MIVSREFSMSSGHPVLPGHFPGDPIVPGVILMAWCEQLAAELADAPVVVRSWPNVKFLQPLKPDQICRITLQNDAGTQTGFRITVGESLIASGRFEWAIIKP